MDVRLRTQEIEHLTLRTGPVFRTGAMAVPVPSRRTPSARSISGTGTGSSTAGLRRLKQKTQVFLSPEGDLYRTRLTHTLEVSQIARTIARALRLNEDLTEAVAWPTTWGTPPSAMRGSAP